MLQHLRYGLRTLARTPSFTISAVLCLALGIGATTAIFSIVNTVLLRPLPYRDSGRLVRLYTEFPSFGDRSLTRFWMSVPEYFRLKDSALKSFEAFGAYYIGGSNLSGSGQQPIRVTTGYATASGFAALGVQPDVGRLFTDPEDRPGAQQTLLLSNALWKRAFGGDPNIVGREIYQDSAKCRIIGVMPPGFVFPPGETDSPQAWGLLQLDPASRATGSHFLSVFARLRPRVGFYDGKNEIDRVVAKLGEANSPNNHTLHPKLHPVTMYSMVEDAVGNVRKAMLLLLGAVGFLLLIACLNVVNLILARSEARQRETAIRRALGASRGQLVGQYLTEGGLLSVTSALAGTFLAFATIRLVAATNAGSIPRVDELSIDWRVLLFTFGVAVLIGVFFGFAPLSHASAIHVSETLKSAAGRMSASLSSNRFRGFLVAGQIAMAFVLLAGASLMIDGFIRLEQVRAGFDPSGLLTFSLSLPNSSYKTPAALKTLWQRLEEKLASIPGVDSVALMSGLPPVRRVNENDTQIEGWVRTPGAPQQSVVYYQAVNTRFFQTLGIRLVDGRFLDNRDFNPDFPGVIINQAMAHTFWPQVSPIGRRIRPGFQGPWYTIVGIVADVKNHGVDRPTDTEIFTPYQVTPFGGFGLGSFSVAIKTQGDPKRFANASGGIVASIDPSLPMADVRTMDEVMQLANARPRFYTLVLTMFSALALMLAGLGVYGIMSYAVTRRTTEFGIRLALGAEPARLFGGVITQGLLLTATGAAVGSISAFFLTKLLRGLVFGVQAFDLQSFLVTLAVLAAAAILATSAPAARVIRIQLVQALRDE